MPGINDALKKHCPKGSDADSGLSVWKPRQETSEQTDETASRFVPLSHPDSSSDSSESTFFQITKKPTPPLLSSSSVWDDQTENPAFGGEPSGLSGFEPPVFPSPNPEPPFHVGSAASGLRDKLPDLPPLWGVDLALILVSVIGLAVIALHFEAILMAIAFCVYRLFDVAIWIVVPVLALLLLFRILLRRR